MPTGRPPSSTELRRFLAAVILILAGLTAWSASPDPKALMTELDGIADRVKLEGFVEKHRDLFTEEERKDLGAKLRGGSRQGAERVIRNRIARLELDASAQASAEDSRSAAQAIVAEPGYRTKPNDPREGNFIQRAFAEVGRAIVDGLAALFGGDDRTTPDFNPSAAAAWGDAIIRIMQFLLIAAVVIFAAVFLWKFRMGPLRRRRAGGLLEDDEPDRSADEWLGEADRLAAAGRHREAVRGLFLASLLRLDEAKIASFRRGETNWEHCRRIMDSRSRPESLEFRSITREFDRIWYGMKVKGQPDVDRFRSFYQELLVQIREAGAR
ncbi:MAG: hypothetical protein MH204_08680 [Fimbriimonadaceae bacterium]|nr:hypothetical protein [Fimbriimonadaceae bacterium]